MVTAESGLKLEMQNHETYSVAPSGPPRGEVWIHGAKNAALPLIAASILAEEGVTVLKSVPQVRDVVLLLEIIRQLGAKIEADWTTGTVSIDCTKLEGFSPNESLCGELRGSLMLMAPLLARFGAASIGRPGGCSIGARQFDLHLTALETLGAEITQQGSMLRANCNRLNGAPILLDIATHTGTQQAIMAAVKANGTTRILNSAREPEVGELCNMLNRMGAKIEGVGSSELTIHGQSKFTAVETTVNPSRLETAFYAMVAALPGGHVTIHNPSKHAEPVMVKLAQMGAKVWLRDDVLEVKAPAMLEGTNIVTWPYPGFPTDSQSPMMALCCFANGRSIVREKIFENRFQQAAELQRMGADILVHQDLAVINGPSRMRGADVRASDLQAGISLVLAAVGAEGTTNISNFSQIDRGYFRLKESLGSIGTRLTPVV